MLNKNKTLCSFKSKSPSEFPLTPVAMPLLTASVLRAWSPALHWAPAVYTNPGRQYHFYDCISAKEPSVLHSNVFYAWNAFLYYMSETERCLVTHKNQLCHQSDAGDTSERIPSKGRLSLVLQDSSASADRKIRMKSAKYLMAKGDPGPEL